MESEYYVTLELSNRCRGLWHQHRGLNLATVTVEDIERWIWKEHGFFIETSIMPDCDEPFTVHIYSGVVYMGSLIFTLALQTVIPFSLIARYTVSPTSAAVLVNPMVLDAIAIL